MKIHDLEYVFFRSFRRFRGNLVKAFQKGTLSQDKILRLAAFIVLSVSVLGINLRAVKEIPVGGEEAGIILSARDSQLTPTPILPKRIDSSPDLDPILARSALIVDATSSAVLYRKDPDITLPPASTTKMMTALITLQNYSPDEVVSVPEECTRFDGGPKMGLKAAERIKVENLLYGLLLPSASDSACTLVLNHGFTPVSFVVLMNDEAGKLGMEKTIFKNPTGLDESGVGNVSTAADLLKLTIETLRHPVLRKIVGAEKMIVVSEDGAIIHSLVNTNELLANFPGILGVKTGFTEKAGGNLSFFYTREGREIVGVVLGSTERGRFEDTRQILNWIFRVYQW